MFEGLDYLLRRRVCCFPPAAPSEERIIIIFRMDFVEGGQRTDCRGLFLYKAMVVGQVAG